MLIYNLENIAKHKVECKIPISNNSLLFKNFIISLVKHFFKKDHSSFPSNQKLDCTLSGTFK